MDASHWIFPIILCIGVLTATYWIKYKPVARFCRALAISFLIPVYIPAPDGGASLHLMNIVLANPLSLPGLMLLHGVLALPLIPGVWLVEWVWGRIKQNRS